jgi:hypothetical protein
MYVCVCASVCAYACVCLCLWVSVHVCMCVCVCVRGGDWALQLKHLQKDMLDVAYTHFNKTRIARLTERIAQGGQAAAHHH